jgi:hypothetical protein
VQLWECTRCKVLRRRLRSLRHTKITRVEGFAQGATGLFHLSLLRLFVLALGPLYFKVAFGILKPRKAGEAKSWSQKATSLVEVS